MANKYPQQRGGQRGSDRGGNGGAKPRVDMREEYFARPAAEEPVVPPQLCSDCHDEPLVKVLSIVGNRRYENDFFNDAINQRDPLGDNCARRKTLGIIGAETGRIEHVLEVLQQELPNYDLSRIETTLGDKLAEIEDDYIPDVRYGDAIKAVRALKRVTFLRCAEALIVEAKRLVEPFRATQDGASLLDRINALEKDRVGMSPGQNGYFPRPEDGGARPDRDEFSVFKDAQRLRFQAVNIGAQEERRVQVEQRREQVAAEVRGTFSSRFRRSASAATSDEADDTAPATLADDPENAAKLASVRDRLEDESEEPTEVPAALSSDAGDQTPAATDASAPVETDTPAVVE